MSCGCDCGSILVRPVVAPVSPLEIVAADDIIAGWDAAIRVAVGTALFTLPDVSGNGFNLDQAVALNQAAVVVGGGPNGNDSILFDGINDFMSNAVLDFPPPGTTPLTYWGILRQITWTAGEALFGANGAILSQQIVTPSLRQFNGAGGQNDNGGFTLNTYMLLESLFNDSPLDFIKVAGVTATGVSAGNTDPAGGFFVGTSGGAGITFSHIELCELWTFRIALSIQQRSQLRTYATNRYGAIP